LTRTDFSRPFALLAYEVPPDEDALPPHRLKDLRVRLGIPGHVFATAAGCSPKTLDNFENGRISNPHTAQSFQFLKAQRALRQLATFLGVNPE
jgi:DNA-binding transcriptional regulator YiaG